MDLAVNVDIAFLFIYLFLNPLDWLKTERR